tara:strand:- start:1201 stop:1680 length:480 start_codon:yes stop_codon:yes gene_type:complete
MKDMLVKLYELPEKCVEYDKLKKEIDFRRPLAAEKYLVTNWVNENFGEGWKSEVDVSFSKNPISTYIAIKDGEIIGFSTYDAAYLNFLGPMGVSKKYRKKGLGKVLLYLSLKSMKEMGYAYAIIGGVGPAKFYEVTFGAKIIKGSDPGIYKGILSHVPV